MTASRARAYDNNGVATYFALTDANQTVDITGISNPVVKIVWYGGDEATETVLGETSIVNGTTQYVFGG